MPRDGKTIPSRRVGKNRHDLRDKIGISEKNTGLDGVFR